MIRKHLTKFENDNEYTNFIFSNDIVKPNVSLINTNNTLHFGIVNEVYSINDVKTNKKLFENCKFFYEDINKEITSSASEKVNELFGFKAVSDKVKELIDQLD